MDPLLLTLKAGKLQGKKATNYKGEEIHCFQGIPYARPPLKDLRFKPPVPAYPWEGILDATKCGEPCIQKDTLTQSNIGSEDCLYLNVYTKSTTLKVLKPVMVWIHGGAFTSGSGDTTLYGPDYLLIEDIVLVTINYRLGLLGFLSFDDTSLGVTGNMGLKDQVLALKWVQENIQNFGGDPNNVTIFGESAGGASVHYQVLSPLSRGLFHKAILQSGVALNVWAQARPLDEEGWTKMGIQEKDSKKVLEYLKTLPAEKIRDIQNLLGDNLFAGTKRYLGPVVERPDAEQPFITLSPLEIIKSGNYNQIPLIIGYTSEEGILIELSKSLELGKKDEVFNDISVSVPHDLEYPKGSPQNSAVGEKLFKFYFDHKEETEKATALYTLFSDTLFIVGIRAAIKHHSKSSEMPIYHYKLTLEVEELAMVKKAFGIKAAGVSHGDDIGLFFPGMVNMVEIKQNSEEDFAIRKMVRMWTNFARTGNPTPIADDLLNVEWKPVDRNDYDGQYFNIGKEFKMESDPEDWKNRLKFWKSIYDDHPKLRGYL